MQWDYRDWGATMRVPAIVGAFPEPFLNGIEGKRRPVRVECEDAESEACETVKERLRDLGVAATGVVARRERHGERDPRRGRPLAAVRLVQALAEIEDGPEDERRLRALRRATARTLELLGEDGGAVEAEPAVAAWWPQRRPPTRRSSGP